MIYEVRSKVSRALEANYTIAVCDGCKKRCEESKLPGRRGESASIESVGIAHRHGWIDRTVSDWKPRARKVSWTIQLLCPECQ